MVIIFSYERPEWLKEATEEWNDTDHEVVVLDDGSAYDPDNYGIDVDRYIRNDKNLGKTGFWKQWDYAFKLAHTKYQKTGENRFLFLPDDYINYDVGKIEGFFDVMDHPFGCNVVNVGWTQSWTRRKAEPLMVSQFDMYRVGFLDHGTMLNAEALGLLGWEIMSIPLRRWKDDHRKSSGVGRQISTRLEELTVPMYKPKESWADNRGVGESKMNPDERKRHPNHSQ